MATEIIETDVVASAPRRKRLGSRTYRVPTSPTLQYMFWMQGFLKRLGDQTLTDEDLDDCLDQTVVFLRRYNDDVDVDALKAEVELTDLISFYPRCFGVDADHTDEEEAPRPTKPRRGTSGQKRPTAKRSPS